MDMIIENGKMRFYHTNIMGVPAFGIGTGSDKRAQFGFMNW